MGNKKWTDYKLSSAEWCTSIIRLSQDCLEVSSSLLMEHHLMLWLDRFLQRPMANFLPIIHPHATRVLQSWRDFSHVGKAFSMMTIIYLSMRHSRQGWKTCGSGIERLMRCPSTLSLMVQLQSFSLLVFLTVDIVLDSTCQMIYIKAAWDTVYVKWASNYCRAL